MNELLYTLFVYGLYGSFVAFQMYCTLALSSIIHEAGHLSLLKHYHKKLNYVRDIKITVSTKPFNVKIGEQKDYNILTKFQKTSVLFSGVIWGLYMFIPAAILFNKYAVLIALMLYSFACVPDIKKIIRNTLQK